MPSASTHRRATCQHGLPQPLPHSCCPGCSCCCDLEGLTSLQWCSICPYGALSHSEEAQHQGLALAGTVVQTHRRRSLHLQARQARQARQASRLQLSCAQWCTSPYQLWVGNSVQAVQHMPAHTMSPCAAMLRYPDSSQTKTACITIARPARAAPGAIIHSCTSSSGQSCPCHEAAAATSSRLCRASRPPRLPPPSGSACASAGPAAARGPRPLC